MSKDIGQFRSKHEALKRLMLSGAAPEAVNAEVRRLAGRIERDAANLPGGSPYTVREIPADRGPGPRTSAALVVSAKPGERSPIGVEYGDLGHPAQPVIRPAIRQETATLGRIVRGRLADATEDR